MKDKSKKDGGKKKVDPAPPAPVAAAPENGSAITGSRMPMFYTRVEVLNARTHGSIRFHGVKNYGFAGATNFIPVADMEFYDAASHYPIVFSGAGENISAVVIVGQKKNQNHWVDENGAWRSGVYIPAYVRRFPFTLVRDGAKGAMVLGADMATDILTNAAGGEPIYQEGKPTAMARRALEFCVAFQQAFDLTRQFCQVIEETGILIDRAAEFTLPTGKSRIRGFKIIDEAKLNALPPEGIVKLHNSGALPLVYAHLASMKAWRNLLA